MPETFDAVVANPGVGGSAFAGDSFTDAGAQTRFMPFTVLCLPDGAGYARITSAAGIPVVAQAGATFPISAVSLPLPTGAATSAKQPVLGTAGAASVDVLTVQGISSMTPLKVDASATTQPVSGTFWQATQPVSGTFWQATQPVSAVDWPLPAGASISAKQPALGTAGTPASDVITVQGVTSMTALQVDGSAVTQPISGTVTANVGTGTQPISASSLPLPGGAATEAKQPAFAVAGLPSADVISVQGKSGMTAILVDGSATTQPVSGTVTANAGTGTMAVSASSLPLPAGASTAAKQPALGTAGTPATDVLTVQGHVSMTALKVDGSAVTQPVSPVGTFAVAAASLPLPTGAATAANQTTAIASLASIDGKLIAAKTADFDTGGATDSVQMVGFALPASGGAVAGGTATNPLRTDTTGTTTQPVSAASLPLPTGAATAARQAIPGSAGTASGEVITVQGVTSMVPLKVDGSAVTQPISGTITANAGSGTMAVSAATLPLPSGASTAAKQPALGTAGIAAADVITIQGIASMTPLTVTGTVTSNAGTGTLAVSAASLPLPTGAATEAKQPAIGIAGTPAADVISVQGRSGMTALTVQENGAALTALQLLDDAVYAEDAASASGDKGVMALARRGDTPTNTSDVTGDYEPLQVSGGLLWTRPRGMQTSAGVDMTDTVNNALKVNVVSGSTSGTQYTEDAASTADPIGNAIIVVRDDVRVGNITSNDGDNISLRGTNAGELYVKHFDSVEITAGTLPLPAGASTSAKQPNYGTAGTAAADVITVQGISGGTALFVDTELTTADLDTGAGTDTRAVVGLAYGASGGGVLVSTTNPLPVGDNGGSLTVDGTVSASQSGTWTIQPGNTPNTSPWLASIHDGTTKATVRELGANDALNVAIVDGSGNQITSFGGGGGSGTEYVEDAASASDPTGGILLARRRDTLTAAEVSTDGDNIVLNSSSKGQLHVAIADTITVSGTVTANAGTNLNTSALALETGGNLAGAATSLAIIDDWDESDRAKVNLIVGQAGVQGNTGAVSATTIRTTLATDVALPAGTNNIGDVDVLTLPALPAGTNNIGDVDVLTLPALVAGTALIGKVSAGADSTNRYDGTTAIVPKFANIDTASSGNNAVVAAVGSKKIRVISLILTASGAVDVYLNDGTANILGGTRKIKLDNTGAAGATGFVLQQNNTGWFETAAVNRPLNLNLSAAIGVAGCLTYVEV